MSDGFVKLWRKSLNSRCFSNEGLWKVWTWCLMKANHKKKWVSIKSGKNEIEVEVLPGQFIYGRKSAAKQLKMKPETVRTRMEKLKNMQNITIAPTRQYSLISIINWSTYQAYENKDTSKDTSQTPARHQPDTTNKNVKEPPIPPKGDVTNFKSTAEKIYKLYINEINPELKTRQRATKNISTWLDRGRSENDLIVAFKNYAKSMSENRKYRKNPANFYGINEDYAFDFLPVNFENIEDKPKQKIPVFRIVNDGS